MSLEGGTQNSTTLQDGLEELLLEDSNSSVSVLTLIEQDDMEAISLLGAKTQKIFFNSRGNFVFKLATDDRA